MLLTFLSGLEPLRSRVPASSLPPTHPNPRAVVSTTLASRSPCGSAEPRPRLRVQPYAAPGTGGGGTPRKAADSPFIATTCVATSQMWTINKKKPAVPGASISDNSKISRGSKRKGRLGGSELFRAFRVWRPAGHQGWASGGAGSPDSGSRSERFICSQAPRSDQTAAEARPEASCLTRSQGRVAPTAFLSCGRLNPSASDSALGASPGTPHCVTVSATGVPPSLIYRPPCLVIKLVIICP